MMTLTAPSMSLIPPMVHVRTALGEDSGDERRRARRTRVSHEVRKMFADYGGTRPQPPAPRRARSH